MLTEKDCLKLYNIKVLILSRGRYNTISTHNIVPEYIEVLVPKSEKVLYESKINNPILTVPDSVAGLGELRNWVLDNFKEDIIVMMDDDIVRMYCLTGEKTRSIKDKETVLQIIINACVMAKDMGVHFFGFSQTDIRKYNGTDPFKLNSWVGCVVGVIGRKYRFRNDKYKVDIDYTLKNLLVDRIVFCDSRYYFAQNRDNNSGGNSIFRTQEEYEKSLDRLKKKWGEYLKVRKLKNQYRVQINVKRRQTIQI